MLVNKVRAIMGNRLSRNLGWLGLGQVFMRVSRLGTTVVLARMFSQYDYGLISIVYTCQAFAQVFTMGSLGGGVSAKIVEAKAEDLETVCNTTYWVSWMLCILVCVIQCIAAFPIAWFYDAPEVFWPIFVLSFMYLMFPVFKVHGGLIQRENRLKITALGITLREMANNIITVIFALLGFGVWSVVFGLLLSAPVWIVVNYRNHTWRPPRKITFEKGREILQFGLSMMGVEFMDKLRLNIDYLIVGRFLGVDALGLYFLAFNAGLGISKQVINSTMVALFPHLCAERDDKAQLKKQYKASLKQVGFVIIPLVLLQSSLAPFYVPIVFGQKWVPAVPILITICLSAIPLAFGLASYQLLNAVGKINLTLKWNLIYTGLFTAVILAAVSFGVYWVAIAVFICQCFNLMFSIWAFRHVFAKPQVS